VGGTCSRHGVIYACRTLVGKPERKRLFDIPRFRWDKHIRIGLIVMGPEVLDWICLS
jgi:hypothetical protein